MSCITLELKIDEPVVLAMVIAPGYCIVPEQVPADEPLFKGSEAFKLESGDKQRLDKALIWGEGDKYSATDAGKLGEVSLTDDYVYLCVKEGTAGNAIWKKSPMFKS
jgi:hypothetical protein